MRRFSSTVAQFSRPKLFTNWFLVREYSSCLRQLLSRANYSSSISVTLYCYTSPQHDRLNNAFFYYFGKSFTEAKAYIAVRLEASELDKAKHGVVSRPSITPFLPRPVTVFTAY